MEDLDIRPISRLEIKALVAERKYSLEVWGDQAMGDFDARNTLNDWVMYICMYATRAAELTNVNEPAEIYAHLIKAANLALSAAERVRLGTRSPRHYEKVDVPAMAQGEWEAEFGSLEVHLGGLSGITRGDGDGIVP